MVKQKKTKAELEALIEVELNEPRASVSVDSDPMGWNVTTTIRGDNSTSVILRAKQIADRLREKYDLAAYQNDLG
jgi:hypothetical protein